MPTKQFFPAFGGLCNTLRQVLRDSVLFLWTLSLLGCADRVVLVLVDPAR